MKFRMGVLVGLAAGYVLGARAGRARYLQIKDRWEDFAESPAVQAAVEPVREAIEPVVRPIKEAMGGGQDEPAAPPADVVKERLARTGTVGVPVFDVHPPEELLKERM